MGAIPVWQAGIWQKMHCSRNGPDSDYELLGNNALVECVAGIEQQSQLAIAGDLEFD